MPQTYVVTGAAGFIGSHIAERLLRDGQRVRVINLSTLTALRKLMKSWRKCKPESLQ